MPFCVKLFPNMIKSVVLYLNNHMNNFHSLIFFAFLGDATKCMLFCKHWLLLCLCYRSHIGSICLLPLVGYVPNHGVRKVRMETDRWGQLEGKTRVWRLSFTSHGSVISQTESSLITLTQWQCAPFCPAFRHLPLNCMGHSNARLTCTIFTLNFILIRC